MIPSVSRSRRLVCAALFVSAASLAAPCPAAAQALQGRVLLQDVPVADAPVEVHRVTRDTAGVIARATTDAAGSFRAELPPADTAAGFTVFFATAEHLGIRYFGAPLHPGDPRDEYAIAVFDTLLTTAEQAPIRIARRDMVLLPDPQGGWEVNEILRIVNDGPHTLVPAGGKPLWEFRIPAEAFAFEVGEGELDSSGFARMEDRVLLADPLVPGVREVFVRYRIPGSLSEVRIPVSGATGAFNVLVAQPAPPLSVQGLAPAEPLRVEGRTFEAHRATDLAAGATVTLGWRPGGPPVDPRLATLAVLGTLLLIGAIAAGRGRRARPARPTAEPDPSLDRDATAEPPAHADRPGELVS